MTDKGEAFQRNGFPEHLQIHQLARLMPGRGNTTLDQAIALCRQGKCVMCEEHNHRNGPKSCPSANANAALRDQVAALVDLRAAHKNQRRN